MPNNIDNEETTSDLHYTSDMTPLESSLFHFLKGPTAIQSSLIKNIAMDNNPRKIKSEKENAAYWVQSDGTPLLISFPAILDTQGKYGRTGPYFNMMDNVDENNFKRTKALFEVKLLNDGDVLYPDDAISASSLTWLILGVLRDEVEEKRNIGLSPQQKAAVTEFWKAEDVLTITSDPLFEGMSDPSKINTPKISRDQLTSKEGMHALLKKSAPKSSNEVSSHTNADNKCALTSMPDPYGRYANLIARNPHFKTTFVNIPPIRDQNGVLINPSDYSSKLRAQTPIFVTVKLRLWEIAPQSEEKKAASGFKLRKGEENGSRIYQLLLHEMFLLPSNIPAKNVLSKTDKFIPDDPNGKKRALPGNETETITNSKKQHFIPQNADFEMGQTTA